MISDLDMFYKHWQTIKSKPSHSYRSWSMPQCLHGFVTASHESYTWIKHDYCLTFTWYRSCDKATPMPTTGTFAPQPHSSPRWQARASVLPWVERTRPVLEQGPFHSIPHSLKIENGRFLNENAARNLDGWFYDSICHEDTL